MSDNAGQDMIGVGIDLGTANSVVTRVHVAKGQPVFNHAKDLSRSNEIPSTMCVDQFGSWFCGQAAVRAQNGGVSPEQVFNNVKLMLRDDLPLLVGEREYRPSHLVHQFLVFLRRCYAGSVGDDRELRRLTITVPAGATFDADYISGLKRAIGVGTAEQLFDDPQFLDEPDAALLSLGDLRPLDGQTVLLFDMGGGTLDVCVRRITADGGQPHLAALGQDSAEMAGRVVTDALADLLISRWAASRGSAFSDEERDLIRRRNFLQTDETKRLLAAIAVQDGDPRSTRELPAHLAFQNIHMDGVVSARDLDEVLGSVVDTARTTVLGALYDAGLEPADVNAYFMVGGSSGLLQITRMMRDLFGRNPKPIIGRYGRMDPALAVAQGAALFDLQGYVAARPGDPPTADFPVLPTIERKLGYVVSVVGLSGDHETARAIIPKGTVLPSTEFELPTFMRQDSWTLDVELKKGEGNPRSCVPFHMRKIHFDKMKRRGDSVVIVLSIDANGDIELSHR